MNSLKYFNLNDVYDDIECDKVIFAVSRWPLTAEPRVRAWVTVIGLT
jgi:hypothetical protein